MSEIPLGVVVRRVLVILPVAPWAIGYGVIGVAALTSALISLGRGERSVDLGYDSNINTWLLLGEGAWLVFAFAVLVATALLLIVGRRDTRLWAPVIATAVVLLGLSIVWVATMQLETGESVTVWAIVCWPMAAVAALLIGRRLEIAAGVTF